LLKKKKMITRFNTIVAALSMTVLLLSCTKEGKEGPQGPQGPPGEPGELVGSGGTADVKAYTFSKTLIWKYQLSTKDAWLTESGYTGGPAEYEFVLARGVVEDEDVMLTYLELTGPKTFWVQLNHTFQVPATTRFETYRLMTHGSLAEAYYFRVVADLENTTTPYYQPKSLRVIVIPPGNTGTIGNRNMQNLHTLTMEETMEKYHLQESDFKSF
jgi:hypothetical protein